MDVDFPLADPREDTGAVLSGELETVEDKQRAVLALIARGMSRAAACRQLGIPLQQATDWQRRDPTYAEKATVARVWGCEVLEHEIQIAGHELPPAQARVVSENLKWLLSKRDPATYSDRMQLDVHSTVDVAGALSSARERVALRLGSDPARVALPQVPDLPGVLEHGATDTDSDAAALAQILE